MKLIIALPGGGIRGLVQARILSAMPHTILKNTALFAGTSTGGLIAIGLGLGKNPDALESMYVDHGQDIFPKVEWRKALPAFVPKYPTTGIQKVLEDAYGSTTHFQSCRVPVMVNSYDRQKGQPFHFKSWRLESASFLAHEVGRATSAAPTYFESFRNQYWDGGVCSNDPSLDALCEARLLWPNERIVVLSIGNGGGHPGPWKKALFQGFAGIAKELIDALLNSPDESTQYRMECLLGADYLRIDAPPPASVDHAMDDATPGNIKALQDFADSLYKSNEKTFTAIAGML